MTREELVKAGGLFVATATAASAWIAKYGKGWAEAWRAVRQTRKDFKERRALDNDDTRSEFVVSEMTSLSALRREIDAAVAERIKDLREENAQLRERVEDLEYRLGVLQSAAIENVELRAEIARLKGAASCAPSSPPH